ncbi:MAG: RNA polymerase factor sigma-54 [Anaerovoracaceae bacterium]|jgi:RNA polymerase sigma-54 factor
MKLGYDLTIEQTQKLVMTPELIQAIQILQFNAQELDTYVEEQLLNNPVLETAEGREPEGEKSKDEAEVSKEKEEALAELIKERGYDDISYRQADYGKEDKGYSYEQYVSSEVTLSEHLLFQLQFASNNKACRRIGKYIIESLDESGYLTMTKEEMAEAIGTSLENVQKVTKLIQSFDPIGVGAENLGRCLLIQLEHDGLRTEAYEKLLTEYIEDLAANRLTVIAKGLKMDVQEVQEMADFIKGLDPRPGIQFASQAETRYIIPDVIVERVNGEYVVTMNDNCVPRLMISSYYEKVMAQAGQDSKLTDYLSDRMNSAIWLIKSIEQRKQTIMNVVKTIVNYQRDFFDYGNKYLKTLTLKQIAEELGIHESTVSRSINGKYMESPRGVFELKYFFSAGVAGESGEGISSNSVKTHIKEIIDREDPKAPYSDQVLVALLRERGIDISRRTIAKYRDEMNILSSSKRKRY